MTSGIYTDQSQFQKSILLGRCLYLTRNLKNQVFTAAMTTRQSEAVKTMLTNAIFNLDALRFSSLNEHSIRERHEQMNFMNQGILNSDPLKLNLDISVWMSAKEDLGLCINDVDHIRWFCKEKYKNFEELWQTLDMIDDEMGTKLEYAYQDPFGYLTSKLENLGTGLVGEAILHLPALHYTGFIESLAESVGAIGIQIKPLKHCFYKVYNSVTLGRREIEIVTLLDQVVAKLIEREKAGRETLLISNPNKWKDKIGRSYGLASYAVTAEEGEGLEWFSDMLLGMGFGLIESAENPFEIEDWAGEEAFENWEKTWHALQDYGIDSYVGKAMRQSEKVMERPNILRKAIKSWQWRR